jgi:MFS family permease
VKSGALASAGVGAINVFGTLVAGQLVDRAGRKQLLLVSFLGMAAAMMCMSAGLALPQLAVRLCSASHRNTAQLLGSLT